MLRGLEMAEEVVVLERGGYEKDGIERQPSQRQEPIAPISRPTSHLNDDTPSAADDQFEPRGDAAQIALARLL